MQYNWEVYVIRAQRRSARYDRKIGAFCRQVGLAVTHDIHWESSPFHVSIDVRRNEIDLSIFHKDWTMEFYYRVFTTVEKNLWSDEIDAFLEENGVGLGMISVVEEEQQDDLDAVPISLIFTDDEDREVAMLVYDAIDDSDILPDELDEFQALVDEMRPAANRAWVKERLAKTVGCYAFEIKEAGFEDENWDRLATLAEWLRTECEGIEQSDGGQITNENGAVILAVPDDYNFDDFEEEDSEEAAEDSAEELEDDGPWEDFVVALRVGDAWEEKTVKSEEELDEFLGGNA